MERVEVWEKENELSEIYAKYIISQPYAMLHIAPEHTLLALRTKAEEPDAVWKFAVGTEKIANEFFKHNPPTPGEVENAIVTVEDEVMQVSKLIQDGTHLFSSDAAVEEIYAQLDAYQQSSDRRLYRHDLEVIFGRLSAIISGRPASSDTLPQTATFAAALLILREVMFHLGFEGINLCD
jgi:exopolyphosphatase/pppGpp-phosphohydrolase